VKAAAIPTTPNRNPGGKGGNVGSGVTNKHIKVPLVGGSPQTRKTNPATAGDFGKAIGNKVMGTKGTVQRHDPPLHVPAQAPSRLGNDKALEVGRGGPGTGRTVHAKGSQAFYGNDANHPGTINADRSISPPGSNQGTSIKGTGQRGSSFQRGGGARGPKGFGF
jgi:hypothetical protein